MREVDKRYYKINIAGTNRIFTNVYRVGDRYSAYEADKNGKPGKFLYSLSQAEIDRAVISGSVDFKEKDYSYIYKGFLVNAAEYDNGNKETSGVWIYFPAKENEVRTAFENIGLSPDADSGKYFFDDFKSNIKSIESLLDKDLSVADLQDTSEKLNELPNFEILKLNAVMETNAKCNSFAELTEFAYNTDYYDLIPGASNIRELGINLVYSSGIFEGLPTMYRDAIEAENFGRYIAEAEQGIFTSKGYISRSGDEWHNVCLQNFEPKPLKQNGIDDRLIDTTEILAVDLDSFFRSLSEDYSWLAGDPTKAKDKIAYDLRNGSTDAVRRQLGSFMKEYHLDKSDIQPFLSRIARFERCKGIEKAKPNSIKEQLKQAKNSQQPKKSKHREECL